MTELDLPAGWSCTPLKRVLIRNDSGVWGEDPTGADDTAVLRSTEQTEGGEWQLEGVALRGLTRQQREATLLQSGDLVVTKSSGSPRHIGKTTLVTDQMAEHGYSFGNFMQRLRTSADYSPKLAWYVLQSTFVRSQIPTLSTTTTGLANLNGSLLGRIVVVVPPKHIQRAITEFLDRETAQIDSMIDAQQRLIRLLDERERVVALRAVSTGLAELAPEATMESGLMWAGRVPSHWSVGNIRRFAAMKTGHTPSRQVPEYWVDCEIPWFTLADVWQLRSGISRVMETAELISEIGLANSAAELLPTGTVMVSRTASVGFFGIMGRPMATSQDYWNWVCGPSLDPEYLLYSFRAMRPALLSLMAGSTHKTIYEADAAGLRVLVPPLAEQRVIVEYLDNATIGIKRMRTKAQASIDLLRERRAALITAAVTGRIDPRTGIERLDDILEGVAS